VSGRWDPHGRSGPTGGTRMSGWTDGWDPCVRSGRCMGPTCKVGLKKFKYMIGGTRMAGRWDPHGSSSLTGGTRVSGWSDGWDPCVRLGRRMGPTCKVGLKNKCMTGGTRVAGRAR
jgi:hypothetical protein